MEELSMALYNLIEKKRKEKRKKIVKAPTVPPTNVDTAAALTIFFLFSFLFFSIKLYKAIDNSSIFI